MAQFSVVEDEGVRFVRIRLDDDSVRIEAGALAAYHGRIVLRASIPTVGTMVTASLSEERAVRPLLTGTGYRVTPVVALLRPPLDLRHDPNEVEEAFEYPLARLLDPAAPERRSQEFRGRLREFWVWPHERHYIWGATASMLVTLAAVLREGD